MRFKASNFLIVGMCLFAVCSCQQDQTKKHQKLIIGDWYPVMLELDNEHLYDIELDEGYRFTEDKLCENKAGFYSYFYPAGRTVESPYGYEFEDSTWFCNALWKDIFHSDYWEDMLFNVNQAYGNNTSYFIDKDTLSIFDLGKKRWMKYKINFAGKDTMSMSFRNEDRGFFVKKTFIRKIYEEVDKEPLVNQIIFHTNATCYTGTKLLLIRRDGLLFSYGYYETGKFFIARISEAEFERIEALFKIANLKEILEKCDDFVSTRSMSVPYISFVTEDDKIKTIRHPYLTCLYPINMEFYWAYLSGVFLPDVSQLKPYRLEEYSDFISDFVSFYDDFTDIRLYDDNKRYALPWTELFYIVALLSEAKEVTDLKVTSTIEPKYYIGREKTIKTDGRYFLYKNRFGKEIILDIGFNALEKNERIML